MLRIVLFKFIKNIDSILENICIFVLEKELYVNYMLPSY